MRRTTRPEVAARLVEAFGEIDVTTGSRGAGADPRHSRAGRQAHSLRASRILAAGIAGARFVEFEGRNHILVEHEPAWARFKVAVSEFLGVPLAAAPPLRIAPQQRDFRN